MRGVPVSSPRRIGDRGTEQRVARRNTVLHSSSGACWLVLRVGLLWINIRDLDIRDMQGEGRNKSVKCY